jgi:hypothetical protein
MTDNHSQESKNLTHVNSEARPKKSARSIDAPVREAPIRTRDTSALQDKYLKSSRKSAKTAPSTRLNKKEFVLKFVKKDASLVWPREMKMVNSLFKIFPNDDFWLFLELRFKLNSLCWFLSDDGRKFLNTEYKKFLFEPEKPQNFELKNNNIEFEAKIGETVQAPMTVREFLNLWQKKK